MSIWVCNPQLHLFKILSKEKSSALAKDSYFNIFELAGDDENDEEGSRKVSVICRSVQNEACTVHTFKVKKDDELNDGDSINVSPIELSFDDHFTYGPERNIKNNTTLAFFAVKNKTAMNYIMINKNSTIVFDSSLTFRHKKDGFGAFVVAKKDYEAGLLYALYSLRRKNIDLPEGTGVCVIDLNLLCEGALVVYNIARVEKMISNPIMFIDKDNLMVTTSTKEGIYSFSTSISTNIR